jgi:hypothetical protein
MLPKQYKAGTEEIFAFHTTTNNFTSKRKTIIFFVPKLNPPKLHEQTKSNEGKDLNKRIEGVSKGEREGSFVRMILIINSLIFFFPGQSNRRGRINQFYSHSAQP